MAEPFRDGLLGLQPGLAGPTPELVLSHRCDKGKAPLMVCGNWKFVEARKGYVEERGAVE